MDAVRPKGAQSLAQCRRAALTTERAADVAAAVFAAVLARVQHASSGAVAGILGSFRVSDRLTQVQLALIQLQTEVASAQPRRVERLVGRQFFVDWFLVGRGYPSQYEQGVVAAAATVPAHTASIDNDEQWALLCAAFVDVVFLVFHTEPSPGDLLSLMRVRTALLCLLASASYAAGALSSVSHRDGKGWGLRARARVAVTAGMGRSQAVLRCCRLRSLRTRRRSRSRCSNFCSGCTLRRIGL